MTNNPDKHLRHASKGSIIAPADRATPSAARYGINSPEYRKLSDRDRLKIAVAGIVALGAAAIGIGELASSNEAAHHPRQIGQIMEIPKRGVKVYTNISLTAYEGATVTLRSSCSTDAGAVDQTSNVSNNNEVLPVITSNQVLTSEVGIPIEVNDGDGNGSETWIAVPFNDGASGSGTNVVCYDVDAPGTLSTTTQDNGSPKASEPSITEPSATLTIHDGNFYLNNGHGPQMVHAARITDTNYSL